MAMRMRTAGILFMAAVSSMVGCAAQTVGDVTEETRDDLTGTVSIKAAHSGKCADVTGVSVAEGAVVQQWACTGGANQAWRLTAAGTDTYTLVSVNSNKCMTVVGASTANGAGVVQSACANSDNQKFKVISASGGTSELQAVHSGKCLDVTDVSTANGAPYQQWSCAGSANQRFTLVGAQSGGGSDAGVDTGIDSGHADAGVDSGSVDSGNTGGGGNVTADQLLALTNGCTVASSHSYAMDNGTQVNICKLNGAIFWKADMDIDCDGKTTAQCNSSTDCCYYNDTSFHNLQDQPLTASTTPYIVIPTDFHYSGLDTNNGGNVTAVIYNGKLQWAVFGDTGPNDKIGEASYATAQKLGINPDPKVGGIDKGVTYITFVGTGTRPSNIEDQTETATLGQKLAKQLIQSN